MLRQMLLHTSVTKELLPFSNLLEQYNRLVDWICDDEDYEKAEMAKDDLQQWAVNPFLPIFDQVESSLLDRRHFTLRDYLSPETYRFRRNYRRHETQ